MIRVLKQLWLLPIAKSPKKWLGFETLGSFNFHRNQMTTFYDSISVFTVKNYLDLNMLVRIIVIMVITISHIIFTVDIFKFFVLSIIWSFWVFLTEYKNYYRVKFWSKTKVDFLPSIVIHLLLGQNSLHFFLLSLVILLLCAFIRFLGCFWMCFLIKV